MEFSEPFPKDFTIYSKSGCPNCSNVKKLIKEKFFPFQEINCDDYLIENKEEFLSFIENKIGKSYRIFPIVFYNQKFVGGYTETIDFINKLLLSFEELF
jgi:glutaredoxin